MIMLSLPEHDILASHSIPELLAHLFELVHIRAALDVVDAEITAQLSARVYECEGPGTLGTCVPAGEVRDVATVQHPLGMVRS